MIINSASELNVTNVLKAHKHIVYIIVICIILHGLMVLISGAWWDDYKYYVFSMNDIKMHLLDEGRPSVYIINGAINWLPVWCFRLLDVLCWCLNAIFIYKIICVVLDDTDMAFGIALLYNAIPINDIRLMKCVFPYTVALLLFWMAFYAIVLFVRSEKKGKKRICCRVISLVLFFFSFTTNSLLVFYIIPIVVLWFLTYVCLKEKGILSRITFFKEIVCYLDFYFLPFVFWIIKRVAFSPNPEGLYSNYNQVTVSKMIVSIKNMLPAFQHIIKEIVINWWEVLKKYCVMICFMMILILVFHYTIYKNTTAIRSIKRNLWGMVAGVLVTMVGLFPYVVIRGGSIGTVGDSGRDALLIPLGVSIIIYSVSEMILRYKWLWQSCCFFFIILSFFHFSNCYQRYELEYYNYRALGKYMEKSESIKDGTTFLYFRKGRQGIIGERFYVLNTISVETFGDSKRFFADGINSLHYITDYEKKQLMHDDPVYGYAEYNLDDITIDGVIVADYQMDVKEAMRLRQEEAFMNKDIGDTLEKRLNYTYIPVTSNESRMIYENWKSGSIKGLDDVLKLIDQ